MAKDEIIKEIDTLPDDALQEVNDYIQALKTKKRLKAVKKEKPYNVFDEIADTATDVGIKDWARNHDHYLYGTEKR
ncbi:MAG: DUF2281 domain-containing protein [Planctomycetes bacterium]|nr:DUF2281 domain-containing protein [Planctomycetota bacterium]